MSFNSLLSLCTKDSIGCASRRQRGIYRTHRQPLAAPQEHLARSSCGQGPHKLTPMVLLGSGGEGPAGPGTRNLPLNSWSPMQDPCVSLTSWRNSWNKHHRWEWMLLPFSRCLENDHYSSRKPSSPGDLFGEPPESCGLQDTAWFRKSCWTHLVSPVLPLAPI